MAYDTASLPTVAGAAPDWLKFAGGKLALNWLPVSPSHLLWHLIARPVKQADPLGQDKSRQITTNPDILKRSFSQSAI